jgi:S1-C subfamily serine protease
MKPIGTKRATVPMLAAAAILAAGCGSAGNVGSSDISGAPVSSTSAKETAGLQQRFVEVVKVVSPAVVQIQTPQALGSGIVYDGRGDIVTNAHVVAGATRMVVTMASGDSHPAALVGANVGGDLAVIRLTDTRPRPASFADSSRVEVGDIVLAIGNPLGLRSSVTQGIVSAVGRSVPEGPGITLPSVIQTSAPINPGNSGGALVDIAGRVIGIPTLAALDPQMGGAQAPGIGFAIDSNTVRKTATGLIGSH